MRANVFCTQFRGGAGAHGVSDALRVAQSSLRWHDAGQLGALHGFAKPLKLRGLGVIGPALSA